MTKKLAIALAFLVASTCAFAAVPLENHVFVVVEENHSYSSVVGNGALPYLNSLIKRYGLETQYYANTHPSIGNYFMMTTGQIISNNDAFSSTVYSDNIVRHLVSAGRSWKSYAESLPFTGYTGGDVYPYARHHNPFSYFADVVNHPSQRANLVSFTHFPADLAGGRLPRYSFIVPNKLHDAHDGSLATADAWLKSHIGPLVSSSTFRNNGLLVILFDEGYMTDHNHGGGHVEALLIGPKVRAGARSGAFYQHQNLLRLTMESLGLTSFPGAAKSAADMHDVF